MKNNYYIAKISSWFLCAGLVLSSCEKEPEMAVTSNEIIIEAIQTESATLGISANVVWNIKTIQEEGWLTVSPMQGKGNATITIDATENIEFSERIAFIIISSEGIKTDTVKIIQTPTLDVAEKIADDIFRQFCLKEYDNSPKDGKISAKEALSVMDINVKGLEIHSLTGIEYFTKIRKLFCSANNLSEINISKNKDIRILDCSFNSSLTNIDVSELSKLTDLHIHSTKIQNIDVSKNTNLELLTTSSSPIKTLNLSENKELTVLLCNDNQLSELDVSKNTKLQMLYCANNKLSKIDLSANVNLVNLWCNNQTDGNNRKLLTQIDISNNKVLQTFSCAQNDITNLDLSNNPELTQLRCEENQLTDLDISLNTKLGDLKCNNNKLTDAIDISHNKLLKYIDLRKNPSLSIIKVWQGFNANNSYYEKDKNAQWVIQ